MKAVHKEIIAITETDHFVPDLNQNKAALIMVAAAVVHLRATRGLAIRQDRDALTTQRQELLAALVAIVAPAQEAMQTAASADSAVKAQADTPEDREMEQVPVLAVMPDVLEKAQVQVRVLAAMLADRDQAQEQVLVVAMLEDPEKDHRQEQVPAVMLEERGRNRVDTLAD